MSPDTTHSETSLMNAVKCTSSVDPNSPLVQELMGNSVAIAKLIEDFGRLSVWTVAQSMDNVRREFNQLERSNIKFKQQTGDSLRRHVEELERSEARQLADRIKVLEQQNIDLKRELETASKAHQRIDNLSGWLKQEFPDKNFPTKGVE